MIEGFVVALCGSEFNKIGIGHWDLGLVRMMGL